LQRFATAMMSVVFRQAARSTFSCRGNSDDNDRRQGIRLVGKYDWRTPTFSKVFMPYLLQRIEVPGRKHAFLPPNRGYVPLGMPHSAGHVKYSDADIIATHAVYFSRDTTKIKGVWWSTDRNGWRHWLNDDSIPSCVDYFCRLERLMSRQMEVIGS
jgi:hypothetical protein